MEIEQTDSIPSSVDWKWYMISYTQMKQVQGATDTNFKMASTYLSMSKPAYLNRFLQSRFYRNTEEDETVHNFRNIKRYEKDINADVNPTPTPVMQRLDVSNIRE